MTATTTSLAQQIQQAVNSGQQPAIALSDLLAQPSELTGPIHVVVIDVSTLLAGLTDVYKIAAVLPGLPIGQWLPKQDFLAPFFNNVVNLVSVTFTVDANAKALISISLELTLGAGGAGVTLATDIISATVQSLDVTFYPDTPSLTVITIGGSLTINKTLTLDTALSCPSLAFAATIPPGQVIPFSDLLGAFGLDCPAALQPLELTTLDLDFAVRDRSAYLQLALDTANRTPLPIIPNVLALDNLNMELSRAPSGVDASVAAELTVVNKIVVGVLVAGGTGQPWTITGNMDVAQTAANFGKSQVELGDLLAAAINVTLPSQLASFLDTIAIELLDGTVTLGSPITWSLGLEVSVDWSLGGGTFTADTTVTVGNDGTSNTGNIAADLRIGETDGPGLSLQINYDCSSSNNQNITFILPQLGISIPYTVGSNQLTITFNPQQGGPQTLGDLVGDIVEIFTGNPYVVLPSPWSDVLNEIPLPAMTLTVDLATKKVAISLVTNISFFGNTITGVTLGYDPTQPAGDRLTFRLDGSFPVLGIENPTWDPTNPAAAPAVPGQGSKLIDIQLVAAGQRVVLQLPQNPTVEDAVSAIATIAKNAGGSDPNKLPSFDPGAGWLVGTHIVFKSALDFQFVFADPVIYGAVIKVAKQPDSPPAIAALDGLYVEILYRKVSSSIGVYEGMLTLPDKIRKIDYGAFLLQLPSISLDIYTNGDFLIDVGFPHNGDFSKSAVINAGQYIGAGGVYYGHLSGATASALPTVPQVTDYYQNQVPIGTFNTVTEIGIGLRVGFGKSFSSGPLSASVSVVIQAIFEGVFSNFTQFELQIKDPSTNPPQLWHPEYPVTTEYYSITASLGIVGQLQGTIDFAIISASLLVQISIIATVQAESYKAVQVGAEVSVDVELTVSINLGIFSIHIHCSFSTTVSVSTQFGSNAQTVPWGQQQQLSHLRAQMLAAAAPLQLNFNTPPCQNVAISLYVLPQLSRSLVDVTNQSGAVDWVYALQFALPVAAPASGAQGTFADFAQFVTAWAVDAAWPHTGSPTTPAAFYASLTIDGTKHYDPLSDQWRSKIDDLIDALKAILHGGAPANFDTSLQQFFAQGQFTLVAGSASDNGASFGFFPILPPLQLAATGGTMQQGVSGVANNVLRAYALMVATTVLNAIGKKITGLSTLAAAYTALGADGLNGAVGMATRFMLHGTRYAVTSSQLVPVYLATGQELAVDTTAAALTVTVTGPQGATYGVTVPAGGLTLSSAQQQLHPQSDINTYVTGVTTTSVSATTMSAGLLGPVRYSVKNGPVAPLSLRGLPTALMSLAGNPANFALYLTQQDGTETPVPASAWGWCSAINFRVQKVPDPSSPGNNLADVYTLVAVQTDGLARLEALYQAYGTASPTTLEIVYGANANQTTSGNTSPPTFVTVTPQSIFLFQSNISTETNPPRITLMLARAAAAGTDPNLTFLGRLLTGGLTNSGGYFLYLKLSSGSLPDAMFDSRGMAWLTLAVSGFNTTAVAPYFSALRISDQTYAGTAALTLQSPDVTALQPTIASGFVGVQISRPDWSNEDDSKYQRSLDGLFNLIDCIPTALQPVPSGANWSILPGSDQVVGPIKTDATTSTTHIYNAQFDLLAITGQQPDVYPNPPKDAASPYQFAGAQLGLGFAWVDFYGDTLPPGFSGGPLAIGLVDPLLGLDDWPGLSYGFTVTPGPGGPLLIVSMTYIPSEDGTQLDKPAWQQYVKIYHQLATVSLSAQASFLKAVVPLPASQAADVLRANVLTIIGATTRTELAPLQVALPTPVSSANYKDDLLQQLIVSLYFTRPGPVAPGLETTGPNPILVKSTVLAPFQDQPPPLGYQQFATDMEAVLAPLGMRVMAGDLDVPGGAKFWLLRWQGNGLQVGFKPGGMGFAPTPIATSLQSRQGIQPSLFTTAGYNFQPDFFITNPLNPTNMDMDSVLSSFLTAVETFLSPEYAIPAAIAAGPQVDACIAHKQTLAQELAARVVPLAETDADPALLAAATTKYQQACLLDLRNFYAVDADAAVNVTVTAPQTPPDLIVYGHFTLPQGSDIMVSAGQSRISDTDPALAVSLSARHKGWEASFELPTDFRVEALELVTGTISVTDPDEPSGQPRKYVVGTWLRFVTDSDLDLTLASPPTIPLPLRSYPAAPVLSAQSYAQIPGTQLESVKSWSFDCTYLHQPAAQDTVHITAELNGPPKAVRLMATRGLDLLDGLALFQAIYPPISAEFDAHLRLGTSGPTSTTLDAITNFVLLVQCIAENFAYVPTGGNALGGPPGFKFALNEFATDGDPDWQATLTAGANQVSNWTCPLPIVTIDQTPTGEVPTADTVYQSKLVDPVHNLYKFYNGANDALTTVAAVGNSIRSLQIQPLDIVDWHSGRYYLQIIRNETMPLAFRYVTPVIGAKDAIHPLIDNANADVDLSGLPPIPYKNTPPPPGSFGDFLARLYYALLNGQIKDPNPPSGGMRTEVSLSYPLGPAGPPGATPFPDVRVPITLQLVTTSFQFYPSADQAWAMAQPVATAVTTWMQNNNVTASQRPALYASAQFDVTVTVFSAVSTTSLPMIYLDGLYLALTKVSG